MEKSESEVIKNKFDRRVYLLDTYKTILEKIRGYDYRFPDNGDKDDQEDKAALDITADSVSNSGD